MSQKLRKKLIGTVVSNKMDKTVVVQVTRLVKHEVFKKYYNRKKKFLAHDEKNECQIGDKVEIVESKPLSARKRWTLAKIVEKSKTAGLASVNEVAA